MLNGENKSRIKDFRNRLNMYQQAKLKDPRLTWWSFKSQFDNSDGDWQYQNWRDKLPENLKFETNDYNLYGAYQSGMSSHLEDDGQHHLGSRNSITGEILKSKGHPTFNKAIENEIKQGYYPIEKNGKVYTRRPLPDLDISGYAEGTDWVGERRFNKYGKEYTDWDYVNADDISDIGSPVVNGGFLPTTYVTGNDKWDKVDVRVPVLGIGDLHLNTPTEASQLPTFTVDNRSAQERALAKQQYDQYTKQYAKEKQYQFAKDVGKGVALAALEGTGKLFTPSTYGNLIPGSDSVEAQNFLSDLDDASIAIPAIANAPIAAFTTLNKVQRLKALSKLIKVSKQIPFIDYFPNKFNLKRHIAQLGRQIDANTAIEKMAAAKADQIQYKLGEDFNLSEDIGTYRTIFNNWNRRPQSAVGKYRTANRGIFYDKHVAIPGDITSRSGQTTMRTNNIHFTDELGNSFTQPIVTYDNSEALARNVLLKNGLVQATDDTVGAVMPSVQIHTPAGDSVRNGVQAYVQRLNSTIGDDGVVAGSTVQYGNGMLTATRGDTGKLLGPQDTEIYTTRSRLPKLQKKLQFTTNGGINAVGGVQGKSPYTFRNSSLPHEDTEINIIENSKNGKAVGALAHQIYRSLHPKEYAELETSQVLAGVKKKMDEFELPVSAEELLQELKHSDDAIAKQLTTDMMAQRKEKGVLRTIDALAATDDASVNRVNDVITTIGQMNLGKDFKRGSDIYRNIDFSNIPANKDFLVRTLHFPETVAENIAKNQQATKNAFDYWYMQKTTGFRGFYGASSPGRDILTEGVTGNGAFGGGTAAGAGLNTTSANSIGGMGSRPYVSALQAKLTYHPEEIKSIDDVIGLFQSKRNSDKRLYASDLFDGKTYNYDRMEEIRNIAKQMDQPTLVGNYSAIDDYLGFLDYPQAYGIRYIDGNLRETFEIGNLINTLRDRSTSVSDRDAVINELNRILPQELSEELTKFEALPPKQRAEAYSNFEQTLRKYNFTANLPQKPKTTKSVNIPASFNDIKSHRTWGVFGMGGTSYPEYFNHAIDRLDAAIKANETPNSETIKELAKAKKEYLAAAKQFAETLKPRVKKGIKQVKLRNKNEDLAKKHHDLKEIRTEWKRVQEEDLLKVTYKNYLKSLFTGKYIFN